MSGGWVVSGIGMVSASGDTPADLHRALCRGVPLWTDRAGDGPVAPDARAVGAVSPIDGFDPKKYLQARGLKDLSRTSQLACAAAAPLAAALGGVPAHAVGVALGSGWGSLRSIVDFEWETCTEAVRFVNPLLFAETVANVPAGQISIHFGWSAFNLTVSCGSASGIQAIEEGINRLEEGRAPLVLAGGADELNLPALRGLRAGEEAAAGPGSLPFGRGRSGPFGGEGACLLLIETPASARARGAGALARVLAAASGFVPVDGASGAPPAPQVAAFLRGLVDRAGLVTGQVDLMVASACGSQAIDREEARAIAAVFGAGPDAPVVVAPKAILGETWGASGPLAAAAAIETMRSGVVPGRPAALEADPDLPALNMPAGPVTRAVRHAVILASTAAGHVAGLVLARGEAGRGD